MRTLQALLYTRAALQAIKTSPTVQAWAMHPRGVNGASPSKISLNVPRPCEVICFPSGSRKLRAVVRSWYTRRWTNPERSEGPQPKKVVGANGFEPSTSWSRTRRASQAALRPDRSALRAELSAPSATIRLTYLDSREIGQGCHFLVILPGGPVYSLNLFSSASSQTIKRLLPFLTGAPPESLHATKSRRGAFASRRLQWFGLLGLAAVPNRVSSGGAKAASAKTSNARQPALREVRLELR